MSALSVVIAATLVASVLPTGSGPAASAAAPPQNDAGSGGDAGDRPAEALLVAAQARSFAGNLTPLGVDADWFRHDPQTAFCSLATVIAHAPGRFTLAADPDQMSRSTRTSTARGPVHLALVGTAAQVPFLGIEPPPTFAFASSSDGSQVPQPGRYTFQLQTLGIEALDPEGDGEQPDAGPTPTTALPLPDGCAAGRLSTGLGDIIDTYTFDVQQTRRFTFSLAVASGPEDIALSVRSPSGAMVGMITSGESLDVDAGEPGQWRVEIAYTGSHGILAPVTGDGAPQAPGGPVALGPLTGASQPGEAAARSQAVTDYMFSADEEPGETNPCRPACLE